MDKTFFRREIKNSFNENGSYARQLPDTKEARFSMNRAFNMVAEVDGKFIAIECKMHLDPKTPWKTRTVTDGQREGLERVLGFGNRGYIFVCFKKSRGVYKCAVMTLADLYNKKEFSIDDLDEFPYTLTRDNKTGFYNVDEFFNWYRGGLM